MVSAHTERSHKRGYEQLSSETHLTVCHQAQFYDEKKINLQRTTVQKRDTVKKNWKPPDHADIKTYQMKYLGLHDFPPNSLVMEDSMR